MTIEVDPVPPLYILIIDQVTRCALDVPDECLELDLAHVPDVLQFVQVFTRPVYYTLDESRVMMLLLLRVHWLFFFLFLVLNTQIFIHSLLEIIIVIVIVSMIVIFVIFLFLAEFLEIH